MMDITRVKTGAKTSCSLLKHLSTVIEWLVFWVGSKHVFILIEHYMDNKYHIEIGHKTFIVRTQLFKVQIV